MGESVLASAREERHGMLKNLDKSRLVFGIACGVHASLFPIILCQVNWGPQTVPWVVVYLNFDWLCLVVGSELRVLGSFLVGAPGQGSGSAWHRPS